MCMEYIMLTLSVTLSTSVYKKFKFWSKCWSLHRPFLIICENNEYSEYCAGFCFFH